MEATNSFNFENSTQPDPSGPNPYMLKLKNRIEKNNSNKENLTEQTPFKKQIPHQPYPSFPISGKFFGSLFFYFRDWLSHLDIDNKTKHQEISIFY